MLLEFREIRIFILKVFAKFSYTKHFIFQYRREGTIWQTNCLPNLCNIFIFYSSPKLEKTIKLVSLPNLAK
jgi:hypothetical protein